MTRAAFYLSVPGTKVPGTELRPLGGRSGRRLDRPSAVLEQQPPGLGHRHDREPDDDADEPLVQVEVDGVEDPLAGRPSSVPSRIAAREPPVQSRNILSSSTSSENTERCSSRVVSEKNDVADRERRQAHRARDRAVAVVVVGPRDHAERGPADARGPRRRPRAGAAAAGSARRRAAACASSAPRPGWP